MTATTPDDKFITAYRDHGLAIAKGHPAKSCMAELYEVPDLAAARGRGAVCISSD
ncbi:MAG: hypothetical protein U0T56_09315 [Ferruginibacter sp.]